MRLFCGCCYCFSDLEKLNLVLPFTVPKKKKEKEEEKQEGKRKRKGEREGKEWGEEERKKRRKTSKKDKVSRQIVSLVPSFPTEMMCFFWDHTEKGKYTSAKCFI